MVQLQIHLTEGFLYVHRVFSCHLDETLAMSPQGANDADLIRRPETSFQQSDRMEILNPLAIRDVAFAARHILDVLRVHKKHFEATSFQNLVKRDPVHASGFHCDCAHRAFFQPVG